MVDVHCPGPLSATAFAWRQRSGELFYTVVAKLTFRIAQGLCEVAPAQEPIFDRDRADDDDSAFLRAASDLAPFKPATDVTLVGAAFAPKGNVAATIAARLVVGSVDKLVQARADPSAPSRGHRGPLQGDRVPTAGFAPIAREQPSRAGLLRPEDLGWVANPAAAAVPAGFDATYYQAAPADQRRPWTIAPNERIVLENLHPDHERVVTSLPGLEPRAVVVSPREEVVRMVGDTLHVDTDRQTATVTWRAQVKGPELTNELRIAVALCSMGQELGFAEIKKLREAALIARAPASRSADPMDHTAAEAAAPSGEPMPFPPAAIAARPASTMASDRALPFGRTASAAPQVAPAAPGAALVGQAQSLEPSALARLALSSKGAVVAAPIAKPSFLLVEETPKRAAPPIPPEEEPPPPTENDAGWGWGARSSRRSPSDGGSQARRNVRQAGEEPAASRSGASPEKLSARDASDRAADRRPRPDKAPDNEAPTRRAMVSLLFCAPSIAARLDKETWFFDASRRLGVRRTEPDADATRVVKLLSCEEPVGGPDLRGHVEERLRDPARMELPLVLVEGELRPVFDEIETLRMTVLAAQPFAAAEKKLAEAIKIAQDMLAAPLPPQRESALSQARQIGESAPQHVAPPRYIAREVQRALLEQRHFKKRPLFGATYLRMELALPRLDRPLVAYIDESAGEHLPLLPALQVLALGELRPREDLVEQQPEAFVVLALARRLDP